MAEVMLVLALWLVASTVVQFAVVVLVMVAISVVIVVVLIVVLVLVVTYSITYQHQIESLKSTLGKVYFTSRPLYLCSQSSPLLHIKYL